MKKKTFGVISSITVFTMLVSACSSSTTNPEQAGSFSAAVSPTVNQDKIVTTTSETTNKEDTNAPDAESPRKDMNTLQTEKAKNPASNSKQNVPESNTAASETVIEPKTAVDEDKLDQKQSTASSTSETLTPSEKSQKAAAGPSKAADSTVSPQTTNTDSSSKTKTNTTPQKKEWSHTLAWSEFFDNEAQNTPSDKFWDLQGETVTIKGYMGEVLSFDKNWFLLIPAPGAECPFDNGDETYWNKIMMVFVPSDSKLRYTSNPIELKGSLDVGIKIDESGYKTMFRIFDAQITEITE